MTRMLAFVCLSALVPACKQESGAPEKSMDPPDVVATSGKDKVPTGNTTNYSYRGEGYNLPYTQAEILNFSGKPSLRVLAEGPQLGHNLTFALPIPQGSKSLVDLRDKPLDIAPADFSLHNAEGMATGAKASVTLTDVEPEHISGTFTAELCEHGTTDCPSPTRITDGKFRAYRGPAASDESFTRYTQR